MEKQKDKSRYTESFHLNKYVKIALQYVKELKWKNLCF